MFQKETGTTIMSTATFEQIELTAHKVQEFSPEWTPPQKLIDLVNSNFVAPDSLQKECDAFRKLGYHHQLTLVKEQIDKKRSTFNKIKEQTQHKLNSLFIEQNFPEFTPITINQCIEKILAKEFPHVLNSNYHFGKIKTHMKVVKNYYDRGYRINIPDYHTSYDMEHVVFYGNKPKPKKNPVRWSDTKGILPARIGDFLWNLITADIEPNQSNCNCDQCKIKTHRFICFHEWWLSDLKVKIPYGVALLIDELTESKKKFGYGFDKILVIAPSKCFNEKNFMTESDIPTYRKTEVVKPIDPVVVGLIGDQRYFLAHW